MLTGATKFSTMPVSQDTPGRAGPTAPPCTICPNRMPRTPDLSQAGDPASIGSKWLGPNLCPGPRRISTPLSTLTSLRDRRLQLEADMRLLIAYGLCFTTSDHDQG